MRLRQLECFVRICELGSISRAADQLNIAQPALGLQIKNLEHEFGAALLVRSSRGVVPTPAGEILLDWARDVIEKTRAVKQRLRSIAHDDAAVLRLGLTPSMTALLAGPILADVGERLPNLTLRIVEGLSHLMVAWVENETVDLALISGNVETGSLSQMPVVRERLYFVTAGHSNSCSGDISFADVLAGTLAMPGDHDALRRIVESHAREIDLPVTVTYEIASIPAIKDLAIRGVANAILPHGAVRREVETGELAARPITEPILWRTLMLVHRKGQSLGPSERELILVVRRRVKELQGEQGVGAYELLDHLG